MKNKKNTGGRFSPPAPGQVGLNESWNHGAILKKKLKNIKITPVDRNIWSEKNVEKIVLLAKK